MVSRKTINRFSGNYWHSSIVPGSKITAIGTRDLDWLTSGVDYVAINGREAGIFATRPFVTVVGDDGKKHSCHLSRFIPGRAS